MIIYEAELLEESKSLADWAVVGKTFSNEKIVSGKHKDKILYSFSINLITFLT